jgi:hypothetical protein
MLDDEDFNRTFLRFQLKAELHLEAKTRGIANSCNKGSRGAGLLAGYVGIRADVFVL